MSTTTTTTPAGWQSMQRGSRWMYVHHGDGGHVFIVSWHDRNLTSPETPFRKISDENLSNALALLISYGVPLYAHIGKAQTKSAVATTTDLLPAIERAVIEAGPAVLTLMLNDSAPTNDIEKARTRLAAAPKIFAKTGWTVPIDDDGEPIDTRPEIGVDSLPLEEQRPPDSEFWMTSSAGIFYGIQQAVADPNRFAQFKGAPWPRAPFNKGQARGHVELRPPSSTDEVTRDMRMTSPTKLDALAESMWAQRAELSDQDADTLDALIGFWLQRATPQNGRVVVRVDDLLKLRGLKPKKAGTGRRGGYEREQRVAQIRCLLHIHNLFVTVDEMTWFEEGKSGRRTRKSAAFEASPAFLITSFSGQRNLLDGTVDIDSIRISPGDILQRYLNGPGKQLALLSSRAFQYDPLRHKAEKRLCRYLSWQWRIGARNAAFVRSYRVRVLVDEIGLAVNARNPSRSRDRLETAFDRLQTDGVIAEWQYRDRQELPRRGWLPRWLDSSVTVEAPDTIREAYASLDRPAVAVLPRAWGGAARIAAYRKRLGISQLAAAETLGISQAHLSNIERGRARPGGALRTRIAEWMGDQL